MRLVVLAALLRQICAAQRAAKVVLFMSSCDAVQFVHQMFSEVFELVDGEPLLPTTIFKLHGNLAQVRTWQSAKTQAGLMMACVATQGVPSVSRGQSQLSWWMSGHTMSQYILLVRCLTTTFSMARGV